jgi:hypothetical protein
MINQVQTLEEIEIYLFASIQTGCESHSAYYPIGIGVYNLHGKVPRA